MNFSLPQMTLAGCGCCRHPLHSRLAHLDGRLVTIATCQNICCPYYMYHLTIGQTPDGNIGPTMPAWRYCPRTPAVVPEAGLVDTTTRVSDGHHPEALSLTPPTADSSPEKADPPALAPTEGNASTIAGPAAQEPPTPGQKHTPRRRRACGSPTAQSKDDKARRGPRVPNAWILYRSDKIRDAKLEGKKADPTLLLTGTSRKSGWGSWSRQLGVAWRAESASVRDDYFARARLLADQHRALHPELYAGPRQERPIRKRPQRRVEGA